MATPNTEWMDEAACKGRALTEFFPPVGGSAAGRACCQVCPVRRDCLEFALAVELPQMRAGLWGGMSPKDRDAEGRRRAQVRRRLAGVS